MRRLIFILLLLPFLSKAQFTLPSTFGFNKPMVAPYDYLLDDYSPGSTGRGYSVRKLRSAYTGYCMKIRRSNDNAEQDIGFDGDNVLDVAAIASFVGSNSAYVTTWYDQSSAAAHATQTTNSLQPRIVNAGTVETQNGFPSVYFDGTDDNMAFTYIETADGNAFSVFTLVKKPASGDLAPFVGSGSSPGSLSAVTSTDDKVYVYYMSTANHPVWRNANDGVIDFRLHSTIKSSTSASVPDIYKNGTAYTLGSPTDLGFVGDTRLYQLCRYASSYGKGHMSEVVIYQSNESSNRTGIESNINAFYAIY